MIITLEINGRRYTNFLSATVKTSIDNLCNSFSFKTSPEGNRVIPVKMDDECSVYVDGELVTTGYVEVIQGDGAATSHNITIAGRDLTADIVDSSIDTLNDINGDSTLKQVIEAVVKHIDSSIDVIDLTDGAKFTKNDSDLAPEPGDNCFGYLEKLAKKQSAFLNSDANGNIVIYRSDPDFVRSPIINKVSDNSKNNILSYRFKYDNSKRFHIYGVKSSRNLASLFFSAKQDANQSVDEPGQTLDVLIRNGRQHVFTSENPGDPSQQTERAEWEKNIRRARSRVYSCKVYGYRNAENKLWEPNTVVQVSDEYAQISDNLLINSVEFNYGPQGAISSLELVNENSYKLAAEEATFSAKKGLLDFVFSTETSESN